TRRATRIRASPEFPASRPDWGRCGASRNGRRGRGKRGRWTWREGPDRSSREGNVGGGVARQERVDNEAMTVPFEGETGVPMERDRERGSDARPLHCPMCFLYASL